MSRTQFSRLAAATAVLSMAVWTNAQDRAKPMRGSDANSVIQSWKSMPREVAQKMIARCGEPYEVASQRLVWHRNGNWKTTELVNEEIPHDFPMPHKDMLKQTIAYRIDSDRADDLLAYDGSVILERTKGEIAARCDKEEANSSRSTWHMTSRRASGASTMRASFTPNRSWR